MKTRLGQASPFGVGAFAMPAILLFFTFVALPMLLAAGATLTNHRLMSPEPTRYVGLDNYRRLLALEIAAIQRLARSLVEALRQRDPLSERVHLGRGAFVATALGGAASCPVGRSFRRSPAHHAAGRAA